MFTTVLISSTCFMLQVLAQEFLESNSCPESYGEQTYAHPDACDQFVLCLNGTLSIEQCENGLLYDGKGDIHNHCNYYHEVDCGSRKANIVAVSSPGCEFRFGIYAESDACSTKYVKCADGYPNLLDCEPGLAYDERIRKCNWPDQLQDICNPEEVIGFKCPDKVDPDSIQAKFWPYPRYAVPNDCERLITCVDGHPRLISCGDGKLFNDETLTCAEPEEVPKCSHYHQKK